MNEIVLAGCNPVPLAGYLKALGVLRLVTEQTDPEARGYWRAERFTLLTRLSQGELSGFLLDEYRPTPILAPWNGGSGFYPTDNRDGFGPLSASPAPRLQPIADAIRLASDILERLNLSEKPHPDTKPRLLMELRAQASDDMLEWLDAAVVLAAGEPAYPPLLGTGGNDGRLDFTNNFLQRLVELFDPATGTPIGLAAQWLDHALFGAVTPKLTPKAIGQFAPGQVGGPNATSGFSIDSRIDPWDFVLMLEGALLFVTATSRRLQSNQQATLAYPFTVYANSAGGGGMAGADASAGSSRGEIWMPLWRKPARLSEIRVLLGEGRATLGRRAARDGLDFARAVSGLGTDRGIDSFQRYGFMVRNGLAYLAAPIARVECTRTPEVDLIDDLERGRFLDLLRREARAKEAPANLKRAVAQLENALFALTRPGAGRPAIQLALILLGETMQTLASTKKGREAVPALPSLSSAWVLTANDDAPEFRIALALASLPHMIAHLAPVAWSQTSHRWQWNTESRVNVWAKGDLVRNLVRIAERRMIEAQRRADAPEPFAGQSALGARRTDLTAFLSERCDDARIAALLQGMVWTRLPDALPRAPAAHRDQPAVLPIAYRVMKPFFVPESLLRYLERLPDGARWTLPQELPRLLAAGQTHTALARAWRRSHIAGLGWPPGNCPDPQGTDGPRLLAALTIPIAPAALASALPRPAESGPEAGGNTA